MNNVTAITGTGTDLWVATDGGAYNYNKSSGEVTKYTNVDGLTSVDLSAIVIDNHENVLFGSNDGYLQGYSLSQGTWTDVFDFSDVLVSGINVKQDTVWVSAGKGIAVFLWKDDHYEFYDYFVNFPEDIGAANDVYIFNKRVWLASDVGLFSAPSMFGQFTLNDPANWKKNTSSIALDGIVINTLNVFQNILWIGSTSGLYQMGNDNSPQLVNSFGSQNISHLAIGSSSLLVSSNNTYFAFNPTVGISQQKSQTAVINALFGDTANIWIGLADEGMHSLDGEKSVLIDGPYQNRVRFVNRDNVGNIWASTGKFKLTPNQGFSIYDGETWIHYDYLISRWGDIGNSDYIYNDEYDNVWLGSWGGGLTVFRNNEFEYIHGYTYDGIQLITQDGITTQNTISANPENYRGFFGGAPISLDDYEVITAIKEDGNGNLWILNPYSENGNYIAVAPYNSEGFLNFDKSKWTYFGVSDGIRLGQDPALSSIEFDDYGRVWIGTFNDGLIIIDYNNTLTNKSDDQIYRRDVDNNLAGNAVRSIAKDKDGVMWIGTESGLSSYDGLNFYRHVGDENGTDGPLGNTISQIVVDDYNNKWVATSDGLSILRAGKSVFESGAWIGFNTSNSGLISNQVNSVFVDSKNAEALIGTEKGISVYKGSFVSIRPDFKHVSAGPNPFILNGESSFIITNLKNNSSVKIFTVSGTLVRELTSDNESVNGGRASWDGHDLYGKRVATGIYLYVAYTDDGQAYSGKIAVIRK